MDDYPDEHYWIKNGAGAGVSSGGGGATGVLTMKSITENNEKEEILFFATSNISEDWI